MSSVGQIVYNLEDYNNSGGYISTSGSSLNETVSSVTLGEDGYNSAKIDIFSGNLVTKYTSGSFSKLGIQAPSGTKVLLNTSKLIMIGRTGIYELDEDVPINSIKFERPKKYERDEVATEAALQAGKDGFLAAEQTREQALQALEEESSRLTETAYWSKYSDIQETYNTSYQEALSQFNTGLNGVYKLPNPDNVNDEANYQDLYNIIIDFIY